LKFFQLKKQKTTYLIREGLNAMCLSTCLSEPENTFLNFYYLDEKPEDYGLFLLTRHPFLTFLQLEWPQYQDTFLAYIQRTHPYIRLRNIISIEKSILKNH
jgi:hypothetical protein